ncbi:methylmalonyl-CoA mutase family protein [Bacillus spongiae]|uniref:Methylmalonyl-CoA mutase family protein n=2 Tax=Bacillus spongiae TaxID=2683610 RepID=A0ABU8HG85_9BACI
MGDISRGKFQQFQKPTLQKWEETATASLKGRPLPTLSRKTYENILIKPLYTKEDVKELSIDKAPAGGLHTRGFESTKSPWHISQRISGAHKQQIYENMMEALSRGQSTISIEASSLASLSHVQQMELFQSLPVHDYALHVLHISLPALSSALEDVDQPVTGIVATDPVANGLESGQFWSDAEKKRWVRSVQKLDRTHPQLQTLLVDVTLYEESGASAVQQLGIALGVAVNYLDLLQAEGWSVEKIISKLVFHFSFSSDFFTEVSKIRAFRALLTTLLSAYDVPPQKVTISGETSRINKSKLDEHVNILRAGNEAFAAVVAGVDYLTISPFTSKRDQKALADRLARNTQLILRDEVQLGRVLDPSGGSFYIESFTHSLIDRSWKYFQQIEGQGGLLHCMKSGEIQQTLHENLNEKKQHIQTRKQSMIGTNIYASLLEDYPNEEVPTTIETYTGERVAPIKRTRFAEEFEQLKIRGYKLAEAGHPPKVGVIALSSLKKHKARVDYVTGVLALAGIKSSISDPCNQPEQIVQYIEKSGLDYYCVCGQDEDYENILLPSLALLKEATPTPIDIAGLLNETSFQRLKEAGISGSIHAKQNILEKMSQLLTIWEARG